MRILTLLLISSACFGQSMTDETGKKHHIEESADVPGIILNPGKPRVIELTKGKDYYYFAIAIERIDTSKILSLQFLANESVAPSKVIRVEAESAKNMVGAAVAPGGGIVHHIQNGAKITYKEENLTGKTKVKFRYARGNSGNGTLTMKIGNGASTTLTFPNTGNNVWTNFAEVEFNIPANSTGQIVLESRMQGAADIDWLEYR